MKQGGKSCTGRWKHDQSERAMVEQVERLHGGGSKAKCVRRIYSPTVRSARVTTRRSDLALDVSPAVSIASACSVHRCATPRTKIASSFDASFSQLDTESCTYFVVSARNGSSKGNPSDGSVRNKAMWVHHTPRGLVASLANLRMLGDW